MKKYQERIILVLLGGLFVLFTLGALTLDVRVLGPNQTTVGYGFINQFMNNVIGNNMIWYEITDWLGLVPVIVGGIFGLYGLDQWIEKKKIKNVHPLILILGGYYIVIIVFYVFFETFVVNYRPVLIDGFLEPSYPSTHVFVSITVLYSAILVNNQLLQSFKWKKFINIFLLVVLYIIVVGRILSGVHWFTDIIASMLLSITFIYAFKSILKSHTNSLK